MNRVEKYVRQQLSEEDLERIQDAIKKFEAQTSGEIVINFSLHSYGQPYKKARRIFTKAGLHRTRERNATLIVLYLKERKFAVIGDKGIHEKVPEGFWNEVVEEMAELFKTKGLVEGLIAGIRRLGEVLVRYFPHRPDDVNELPDELQFST